MERVKAPCEPFPVSAIEEALELWRMTPGIGISPGDDPVSLEKFLARNRPTCFLIRDEEGRIAGTVLCGHDGRRGYLYHLAVAQGRRRAGLGRRLVTSALAALEAEGIARCHAIVYANNHEGLRFWNRIGFRDRPDLVVVSRDVGDRLEAGDD